MLFGAAPSAFAQTGRIAGVVVDAGTGDPLPGANVMIQGTSIGAASDVEGKFVIPYAPAGSQILVTSYIGYDRQEMPVEVVQGQQVDVRIVLSWAGIEGDEIVITAQAQGQLQAINEQISARSISNVVSAERIRELPDVNAATAVSRLPGISLQNGDQIVIRGIQANLNTVTINGIQLPSTTTDRTTGLGIVSANMLSGIEVAKTVTPAMDANSIGGNVNLRLREAPEGLRYDALLQGNYNEQDHTTDNYQMWGSVSNRFFGDRFGVFVQGNARRSNGGGDIANAEWTALPVDVKIAGQQPYALNSYYFQDQLNIESELGASLLLDYRIPSGKIILQNAYTRRDFDNTWVEDRVLLTRGEREFRVNRTIGHNLLMVNALQGDHRFGNLSADWSLSHARTRRKDDLGFNTMFNGSNYFDPLPLGSVLKVEQIYDIEFREGNPGRVGDGRTTYEDFGERRLAALFNLAYPVRFGAVSGRLQGGGKFTKLNRDQDRLEYYRRLADGGTQNTGAAEFLRSLGTDPQLALQTSVFLNPDYAKGRGKHYLDGKYPFAGALNYDYLETYFRLAQTGWPTPAMVPSEQFDYVAEERVSAGYLMADLDIGRYLTLLGGVRYEQFEFDNKAPFVSQTLYDGSGKVVDTLEVSRSRGDWFPNIQAQIKPTNWFDVRLAYTKTTSRPSYESLLPVTLSNQGESARAGNPNLKPTMSDNYDAYFSVHTNRIGLFTFGVFAKRLTGVSRGISILRKALDDFEDTYYAPVDAGYPTCADGKQYLSCDDLNGDGRIDSDAIPEINPNGTIQTTVNNPYPGYIRGFEVDWQTNFWYLPRPFNSLVLNVNYTRLDSEMKYQSIFIVKPSPFAPTTQIDSFRVGRLLQQGRDIVNIAVGADVRGFSGRISFRYQGQVLNGLSQNNPADDSFSRPNYGWDFSLRQRLPVKGLSLFFNGVNVTHTRVSSYQRRVIGMDATGVSNATTSFSYWPRQFQLGLRYGL